MSADATLSWSHTSAESRVLRALVALPMGVLAGGVLAVGIGAIGFALLLLVGGDYALGVALLLAVAVSFARVAPHHAALISNDDHFVSELRGVGKRWVVGGAVMGSTVLAVGAQFGSAGFLLTVVGVVLAPLLLASVLTSEGELDPNAGALTYCGTDIDLAGLANVRRFAVGGYGAYWLSYVPGGADLSTPRFVVIPATVDAAVREALTAGVVAEAGEVSATPRAVRAALGAFGLFFVGFAAFLLTVEPTSGHPRGRSVLYYAALVTGVMGALFVLAGILDR